MSALYFYIFFIIVHPLLAQWNKTFVKAGLPSWKGLVPLLNYFYAYKIGSKKPFWFLLMLIPGVHIVMWMVANVSFVRRFGYFTISETLQAIFFPYLLFWDINKNAERLMIPETNWSNSVDVAKRAQSDHVVLFLSLPVLGHLVAYVLNFKGDKPGQKTRFKEWGDSIVFALVAASVIRTYAFEPFQIPTGSMEKTLLVGDFLFVNKLAYGPKVPNTPFSFPLFHNNIPFLNVRSYLGIEKCDYHRLPGFGKINRGDVMVFNYPSGDTAIFDPRVPDGLMGHDYHQKVNDEAFALYEREKGIEYKNQRQNIINEWATAHGISGVFKKKEVDLFNHEKGAFITETILEPMYQEFNTNIEYWRNRARISMGEDKVNYTGGAENEIIKHYGLVYRPVDKRENYIKRCVALPGDYIEIIDSKLYVNGEYQKPRETQNQGYVYAVNSTNYLSEQQLNRLNLYKEENDFSVMDNGNEKIGNLFHFTESTLNKVLKAYKNVHLVKLRVKQYSDIRGYKPTASDRFMNLGTFPKDLDVNNTMSDFSLIQIPYKGKVVNFKKENIAYYRRIITAYEGHKLEEKNGKIFIDGKQTTTYKIQMNYYWLMGDSRNNSADSRVWGFVPEDHVVGKASIVWFSSGSAKVGIRWNRIFKMIH